SGAATSDRLQPATHVATGVHGAVAQCPLRSRCLASQGAAERTSKSSSHQNPSSAGRLIMQTAIVIATTTAAPLHLRSSDQLRNERISSRSCWTDSVWILDVDTIGQSTT